MDQEGAVPSVQAKGLALPPTSPSRNESPSTNSVTLIKNDRMGVL